MKSVSKRTQRGCLIQRGKTFYVKFSLNGKQILKALKDETGKSITNKKAAEKARDKILAPYSIRDRITLTETMLASLQADEQREQEAAKQADDILNPPLSLAKAWEAYLKNQERPQKTGEDNLKNYHSYFQRFYNWIKKNYPDITSLNQVLKDIAAEYSLFLKQSKLSAGTFNKHRDFLKILFHYLKVQAKMTDNPFEAIKRMDDTPNSRRALTVDEIRIIIQRAAGDLQLLLMIGAFTGLRLGDCCTLKWNEIDLDSKAIQRIPNKTGGKAVTVGIPDPLFFKLIEIPKTERKGYIFSELAERYNGNNRQSIPKTIQKHFTDCGIITHKEGTGQGTGKKAILEIGFHSLRHSYISLHAKSGTSQNILTKLAGHSSSMSEHYTHIQPEEARAISQNVFKGFLGAAAEAITVEPVSEATELKERINNALQCLKASSIPEADKQSLLNILEPVK